MTASSGDGSDRPDQRQPDDDGTAGPGDGAGVKVPPIGREPQVWDPPASFGQTRRERASRGRAYASAVPSRIADLQLQVPPALAADAEDAAAEIARFDASAEHGLGAITAVLLRSESSSSSQIEQISASARSIAEAELTGSGKPNAVVVADNTRAMTDAVAAAAR